MTVEELRTELEKTVSEIGSSGFDAIDPGALEKLDAYAITAGELGMKEGRRLIENLSDTMKTIQGRKTPKESGYVRLTALDFYVKKLFTAESTEDL